MTEPTTWRCPTCGHTVTTRLANARADTCTHIGTIHDAKRAAVMVADERGAA